MRAKPGSKGGRPRALRGEAERPRLPPCCVLEYEAEAVTEKHHRVVIRNAEALVTMERGREIIRQGYLVIEDGWIREVGEGDCSGEGADEVIDARDRVVLPGLINVHHHFFQTLTRAFPPALDAGLFEWLVRQYPVWAHVDEEAVRLAALVGMAELMLSGCTTTSDHHYLFPRGRTRLVDVEIEAAREIGIRFHPTRGSMSLGEKKGGLPPDSVVEDEEAILADSQRVIETYHDPAPGAMTRVALAPCAPFNVSPQLMRETARLARAWGVRLHTHLAETVEEQAYCQERFGCRPLDYLERLEWLADDVWLAHGIHFTDEEITRLGRAGVGIAHCPTSNMRLGSGLCRVNDLGRAGCPVGLGVDGSASNDSSNMLAEVRQALLLARLGFGPGALSVRDALFLATQGGARCLGRDDIGTLAPGKAADVAIFSLARVEYSGAGDPVAALVLCHPTPVETLLVHGRRVVADGQLVTIDLPVVVEAHRKKARQLLSCAGVT